MTSPTFNPFDPSFLRDRAARRKLVLGAIAGAVLGMGYWGVAPAWYESVLTVVPAKASTGGAGMAALLGGELGGLAAAFTGGGTSAADTARIAAVLQSVAVTDAVIDKFDLMSRYKASHREVARERLWEHCAARVLPKPNLVQLACEDKDPRFLQEMMSFFATNGNEVFRRVSVSSASEEVRFLERRTADLRKQADESAARMREFQERYGIVDLDSQARALMSSVATVSAQKVAKKMELDYARRYSSADEPRTRQMESQIAVLDEALRDLEVPRDDLPANAPATGRAAAKGLLPAAGTVPKLRSEYEKLYRDRKVAETTLILALDKLETARASEARDVSTFQILDPPALPTRRSRPRLVLTSAVGALLGLVAAAAWEQWKRHRGTGVASPSPGSPAGAA